MTYDPVDELLSAYLDGELTAAEQARVEKLLAESAELRQLHDELRALRTSFEALPRYRVPEDLSERVLRRAERAMLERSEATEKQTPAIVAKADATATVEPVRAVNLRRWIWPLLATAAAIAIVTFGNPAKQGVQVAQGPERGLPQASISSREDQSGAKDQGRLDSLADRDRWQSNNEGMESFGTSKPGGGRAGAKLDDTADNRGLGRGKAADWDADGAIDAVRMRRYGGGPNSNGLFTDEIVTDGVVTDHETFSEGPATGKETRKATDPAGFGRGDATARFAKRSAVPADALSADAKSLAGVAVQHGFAFSPADVKAQLDAYLKIQTEGHDLPADQVMVIECTMTRDAFENGAFDKVLAENNIAWAAVAQTEGELQAGNKVAGKSDSAQPKNAASYSGKFGDQANNKDYSRVVGQQNAAPLSAKDAASGVKKSDDVKAGGVAAKGGGGGESGQGLATRLRNAPEAAEEKRLEQNRGRVATGKSVKSADETKVAKGVKQTADDRAATIATDNLEVLGDNREKALAEGLALPSQRLAATLSTSQAAARYDDAVYVETSPEQLLATLGELRGQAAGTTEDFVTLQDLPSNAVTNGVQSTNFYFMPAPALPQHLYDADAPEEASAKRAERLKKQRLPDGELDNNSLGLRSAQQNVAAKVAKSPAAPPLAGVEADVKTRLEKATQGSAEKASGAGKAGAGLGGRSLNLQVDTGLTDQAARLSVHRGIEATQTRSFALRLPPPANLPGATQPWHWTRTSGVGNGEVEPAVESASRPKSVDEPQPAADKSDYGLPATSPAKPELKTKALPLEPEGAAAAKDEAQPMPTAGEESTPPAPAAASPKDDKPKAAKPAIARQQTAPTNRRNAKVSPPRTRATVEPEREQKLSRDPAAQGKASSAQNKPKSEDEAPAEPNGRGGVGPAFRTPASGGLKGGFAQGGSKAEPRDTTPALEANAPAAADQQPPPKAELADTSEKSQLEETAEPAKVRALFVFRVVDDPVLTGAGLPASAAGAAQTAPVQIDLQEKPAEKAAGKPKAAEPAKAPAGPAKRSSK